MKCDECGALTHNNHLFLICSKCKSRKEAENKTLKKVMRDMINDPPAIGNYYKHKEIFKQLLEKK